MVVAMLDVLRRAGVSEDDIKTESSETTSSICQARLKRQGSEQENFHTGNKYGDEGSWQLFSVNERALGRHFRNYRGFTSK